MPNHLKYIISYIAGCIVNGKQFNQIRSDEGYHKLGGSINKDGIDLNDADNNYSIIGSGSDGAFSSIKITQTDEKFSLNIDLEKGEFTGYDYESGNFSGSVSGASVNFRDSSSSPTLTLY